MLIETAVEEFYFRNKNLSLQTQTWYNRRLNAFLAWCKDHGYTELEQITVKVASAYLDDLAARKHQRSDKPLSTHTQHGHARVIRAFFNFLETQEEFDGHVQPRIGARLPMPRMEKLVMSIFTVGEIKKLFAACDDDSTWPDIVSRNKAILALLIDTGIRASELVGLTIDNCFLNDPERPYIRVSGKGNKQREIGLGTMSLAALEAYLQQYRLVASPPDPLIDRHIPAHVPTQERRVFIGLRYEPLLPNGLQELLRRLGKRAGVEDCHPHRFRHFFACHFIMSSCGDLHSLSKLLGHTDCQLTSSVYLSAVQSMQARKLSKSPLDCLL